MKYKIVQMNPIVGDYRRNYESLIDAYTVANADIVVFPELCLTGYPPNDLLFRPGFIEEQDRYIEKFRKETLDSDAVYILGAATRNNGPGKPFFNSALVISRGKIILEYHKQLLPTYNIFDEARYFEPGDENQNNIFECENKRIAILICEDCWNNEVVTNAPIYPTDPVSKAAPECDVLITLNASPAHVGKDQERKKMYLSIAERYSIDIIYANQVGGQDDLVFDGNSFGIINQKIYSALPYDEDKHFVVEEGRALNITKVDKYHQMLNHLSLGLYDYCRKNNFNKVVVGSSGGIDSALVITLASLSLGKSNVYAITMPSKFSSEGSISHSEKLCKALGVKLFNRSIESEVELSIRNFKEAFNENPSRLTIENMQARIRGRILMEYSNHFGAMLISTGNKSESSVGYATIYGDMCGGLSLIADLYKMEVYKLSRYINEYYGEEIIPNEIINKAPSAELWEGQKDEDSLPPYPVLDSVLELYLEGDFINNERKEDLLHMIKGMTLEEMKRIIKMVDGAEFKRKQSAPTIRVHNRAWGFGRNIPISKNVTPNLRSVI